MCYIFLIKKDIKFLKKYFLELCINLLNCRLLKSKISKNLFMNILNVKKILEFKIKKNANF